ncbi:MAG: DUF6973 domain-containing protein [Moheibacter sp.]
MKRLFNIIQRLSVGMTWKMFRALLSRPLLIIPTLWATVESILFAEINFKGNSSGRDIPNAFRHAVWNLLIAKNSSYFTSETKAVAWAKFITDLHEDCFPNEPFDREMDLHNNQVGRNLYVELRKKQIYQKKEMISELMDKCNSAVGLTDEKTFERFVNELVFYSEN